MVLVIVYGVVVVIEVIFRAEPFELVSVTVAGPEIVPTSTLPNSSDGGENDGFTIIAAALGVTGGRPFAARSAQPVITSASTRTVALDKAILP